MTCHNIIILFSINCLFVVKVFAQPKAITLAGSDKIAILGEGIISTNRYERDFALSPDGTEIFYTLQMPQASFQTILYMQKAANGAWSDPVVAPFAGHFSDLEPAFSADGKQLFFVSNRPVSGIGKKDFDIWVVRKTGQGWGDAKNLGAPVNSSVNEFYPAITVSGNIYFTAEYPNATSKEDIYMCRWNGNAYETPVRLDSNINANTYEFNAYVSPDEQYIIFTSYGRKDDMGGGDLYLSRKTKEGKWQPAKHLALLNSDKLDYCPFVSFDKKTFYFTSEKNALQKCYEKKPVSYKELVSTFDSLLNGGGNIYTISFDTVLNSLTGFLHE